MFSPTLTQLNTVMQNESFSKAITYVASTTPTYGATGVGVSTGGLSYPVVITTTQPNKGITISNGIISGSYIDAFENTISYRTIDDKLITVKTWGEVVTAIADKTLSEIYYYKADRRTTITYNYVAKANNETQTYTIVVTNDWMAGRNRLIKNTHLDRYKQNILGEWINNNATAATIPWLTEALQNIDWENETL
jgi:hypothetical protein